MSCFRAGFGSDELMQIDCAAIVIEVHIANGSLVYTLLQQNLTTQLTPGVASYGRLGSIPFTDASEAAFKSLVAARVQRYGEALREIEAAVTSRQPPEVVLALRTAAVADMRRAGSEFSTMCIPSTVGQFLSNCTDAQILVIVSDIDWIPWEVIFLRVAGKFAGEMFVIVREVASRRQDEPRPNARSGARAFIAEECFIAAPDLFRPAPHHIATSLRATSQISTAMTSTRQEIELALDASGSVWILCHVGNGRAHLHHSQPQNAGPLANAQFLDADFFKNCQVGDAVLVFLGCRTTHAVPGNSHYSSFGREFCSLDNNQRAFVGSSVDTYIQDSVALSEALSRELGRNQSVGRALWRARNETRAEFPGVVFYGMYGDWSMIPHACCSRCNAAGIATTRVTRSGSQERRCAGCRALEP